MTRIERKRKDLEEYYSCQYCERDNFTERGLHFHMKARHPEKCQSHK